ncbi:MAG: DegV family protein, partial [Chloroflexi bacterium]|nr:DegV family protein [Chloroflexota bacterium]
TVSGALSGTYSAACAAAEGLDIPVEVIDSEQISLATGWLVITAARGVDEGQALPAIAGQVRDMVPRTCILGMLDSLDYVQRGGRIGKASALLGTLLNVKPMLQIRHNEVLPVGRARTRQRALRQIADLLGAEMPLQDLAVVHSDVPAAAAELAELLAPLHPPERTLIAEIGPVLGAHLGPGAVGVAFVTAQPPV